VEVIKECDHSRGRPSQLRVAEKGVVEKVNCHHNFKGSTNCFGKASTEGVPLIQKRGNAIDKGRGENLSRASGGFTGVPKAKGRPSRYT